MGAAPLIEHIKAKIGVGEHEVSADGKWSFEEVECMAGCAWAPMMAINEAYHENLTPEKADRILGELV